MASNGMKIAIVGGGLAGLAAAMKIAEDPSRVPDHLFRGLDLLADDTVRSRLFGEC